MLTSTGAPGWSTASAHRARSHHGDDVAPESCTDIPAHGGGDPGRLIVAAICVVLSTTGHAASRPDSERPPPTDRRIGRARECALPDRKVSWMAAAAGLDRPDIGTESPGKETEGDLTNALWLNGQWSRWTLRSTAACCRRSRATGADFVSLTSLDSTEAEPSSEFRRQQPKRDRIRSQRTRWWRSGAGGDAFVASPVPACGGTSAWREAVIVGGRAALGGHR